MGRICKNVSLCRILRSAAETTFQRYVCVTRLMRRFPQPLQPAGKINNEGAASDSAGMESELGITQLDSVLLPQSKKQDALLFVEAAAVAVKGNTKEKRAGALFNTCAFYSCTAALLKKFTTVLQNVIPASDSTSEQLLSAHVLPTKTYSLSVRHVTPHYEPVLPRPFREESNTGYSRERPLPASHRRFARTFSTPAEKKGTEERTDRNPPPMTPADSRRF